MSRRYVVSKKEAMLFAGQYDNGAKKPGLSLNWATGQDKPRSIKEMQMNAMRKVPVSLPKIPESRILTKEELK